MQNSQGRANTSLTIAPRQPAGRSQFWGMRLYNRVKHDLAPTKRARGGWSALSRSRTARSGSSRSHPGQLGCMERSRRDRSG